MSTEQQYAVLVDAENVSPKYINIIFDEASNYGITTYRRIYSNRQALEIMDGKKSFWITPLHPLNNIVTQMGRILPIVQ